MRVGDVAGYVCLCLPAEDTDAAPEVLDHIVQPLVLVESSVVQLRAVGQLLHPLHQLQVLRFHRFALASHLARGSFTTSTRTVIGA